MRIAKLGGCTFSSIDTMTVMMVKACSRSQSLSRRNLSLGAAGGDETAGMDPLEVDDAAASRADFSVSLDAISS